MRRKNNTPGKRASFVVEKKGTGNFPAGVESYGVDLDIQVGQRHVTLTLSGGHFNKGGTYSSSDGGTWQTTANLGRRKKFRRISESWSMNYRGEDNRRSTDDRRIKESDIGSIKSALIKLGDKIYKPFSPSEQLLLHDKLLSIGVDIPTPAKAISPTTERYLK